MGSHEKSGMWCFCVLSSLRKSLRLTSSLNTKKIDWLSAKRSSKALVVVVVMVVVVVVMLALAMVVVVAMVVAPVIFYFYFSDVSNRHGAHTQALDTSCSIHQLRSRYLTLPIQFLLVHYLIPI